MRILLVHNYYQQPGGEDQVFSAEGSLLERYGHEVLRFTKHNDEVRQYGAIALARATLWNQAVFNELRMLIREQRPEVVHFHNTFPLISPAAYYAANAEGVAVVQTLHNYRLLCPNALFLRDGGVCEDCLGRSFPLPAVIHSCYRDDRAASAVVAAMLAFHRRKGTWNSAVDLYLALTEFARSKFIEGGLPAERIIVKPNFVAHDPGAGTRRGNYALFVGRLSPEKGIGTLLDAWRLLGTPIPLKIVGTGPLESLRAESPAGVEWMGTQDRENVFALMREATLLIVPSESYETFGLTIIEAFATGLPVIASRLGAAAEIVRDHETGVLFEPGNPQNLAYWVQWCLENPEITTALGNRGRQEYERKYSADRNYAMLIDAYRRAADRSALQAAALSGAR